MQQALVVCLVGLVLVWTSSILHAQPTPSCPADSMLVVAPWITSTAPEFYASYCPFDCQGVPIWTQARGSWPLGAFTASAFGQQFGGSSTLVARDQFVCSGIEGTRMLTVRVDLSGRYVGSCPHPDFCSGGYWEVLLRGGGAAARLTAFDCGPDCRQVLEIAVPVTSDVPFELRLLLYADAYVTWSQAEGAIEARLGFPDLPAGATIRSCKGFTTEVPTRAMQTSWGRLKAIYR